MYGWDVHCFICYLISYGVVSGTKKSNTVYLVNFGHKAGSHDENCVLNLLLVEGCGQRNKYNKI